jgi:hypothetical protein
VIISTSRHYIFVHIHKTGGESITATLEQGLDQSDLVLHHAFERAPRPVRRRFAAYAALDKHSTALAIMDTVPDAQWRDSFKFSFVRHPIERAVSYYNYCAREAVRRTTTSTAHLRYYTPRGRRLDPRRWPSIVASLETSSFSEFIRHPALADDQGMRPQFDSICDRDGNVALDFIGRLERIDEDFAKVQAAIGVSFRPTERRNVTEEQLVTRSMLSRDDIDFLSRKYEVDFARLDYEL